MKYEGMMKGKYRVTLGFKILVFQFISSFLGLIIGFVWGLNMENERWSQLIYSDIKIADIDLGGKTKEEARNIINTQYIDNIYNKKLYVTIDGKTYSINKLQLIKSYSIDSAIDKAFSFGKDLNIIKQHELINLGSNKAYNLDFTCDDGVIRAFISKIEKEINKNPINAIIKMNTESKIQIQDDIKGAIVEKEKLYEYIKSMIESGTSGDIYIKAPVKEVEAEIKKSELSGINTCISSFSTSFKSSSFMRVNNIKVCINAINGTILMPGETFSFNDVVGERTKERGYMEAPVIIDNKIESGIGGGICQVSSTLYNAILKAGIQNIERINHSLPSSYVELGLDATVDWQNIDFKFVNTLNYPIYIEGHTENGNLYINIFSNSDLSKKVYVIENDVNRNDSVYKVKVIRKTYENGMLINSEFISNDTYALISSNL